MTSNTNPHILDLAWPDRVFRADEIWRQVRSALSSVDLSLPTTPRRPDVRLIVDNSTGTEITFKNPGDHSGGKPEVIPASGDSTAVMIMVAGDTLEEQIARAEKLAESYSLGTKGLSHAFVEAMTSGRTRGLVKEAYGPAPFASQVEQLVNTDWINSDGSSIKIEPVTYPSCAYGVRAAVDERVIMVNFPIYIQGSDTTPELTINGGICVAVDSDWQSGREKTRPIAPSVAHSFYGDNFSRIPVVTIHPDGGLERVEFATGDRIVIERRAILIKHEIHTP